MTRDSSGQLLTPLEVGQALGFTTPRPVYRLISEGKLQAARIRGRWLITQADLDAMIAAARTEGPRGGLRELERS